MVVAVLLVMDGPLLTVIMVMTMVFLQRLLLLKMAAAAVLVVRVAMIGGCCDAAETQARSKIPRTAQRRCSRNPAQSRCMKRTKPTREAKFHARLNADPVGSRHNPVA